KQTPHLHLAGSFINPIEALQMLTQQKVDLVFLDIQMPELSGIDFIKTIQGKSKVILTTAYSEFALEGYELYVVDYLMKPIRLPRFLTAVQKAMEQIGAGKETTAKDEFIFVKTETKGKVLKINLAEIDFIEAMKNYVIIHRSGQKIFVYTSMKELEERLPGKEFIRIHKSYIIPVSHITGIEGNMVRLKNVSSEILIGENYKASLMALIKGKMIQ
ncbi:MAG TPA: LytTR family DNA-binding domain-containing protein, partial [Chitinophagaceae bacterium]|nr:LytTR family DNA-binding domain-containing protein [Chitinophagaceae bacterium]